MIPLRPTNDKDFAMEPRLKDTLTYSVLFSASRKSSLMKFYPHFIANRTNGKTFSLNERGEDFLRQMENSSDTMKYLESYRRTLEDFLNGKNVQIAQAEPQPEPANTTVDEISDSRKDNALANLLDRAMSLVETNSDLDPDTLKTCTEIFKRLNILKEAQEEEEKPRRYLPARCYSECQYRLFCEKAIENGEIENECQYCKALAIAQEHGYKYDPTTILSIPQKDV